MRCWLLYIVPPFHGELKFLIKLCTTTAKESHFWLCFTAKMSHNRSVNVQPFCIDQPVVNDGRHDAGLFLVDADGTTGCRISNPSSVGRGDCCRTRAGSRVGGRRKARNSTPLRILSYEDSRPTRRRRRGRGGVTASSAVAGKIMQGASRPTICTAFVKNSLEAYVNL